MLKIPRFPVSTANDAWKSKRTTSDGPRPGRRPLSLRPSPPRSIDCTGCSSLGWGVSRCLLVSSHDSVGEVNDSRQRSAFFLTKINAIYLALSRVVNSTNNGHSKSAHAMLQLESKPPVRTFFRHCRTLPQFQLPAPDLCLQDDLN